MTEPTAEGPAADGPAADGPGAGGPGAAVPAVQAAGIHKQFGSTQALRGVDITLWPGRCLGLVGRNGAGKSTLVSILSGLYPPDAGTVRFEGNPAPPLGAVGAWRDRIATVFQHSMVVPGLTVAENVFLGRQPRRAGLVDWRAMREQTRAVMSEWGYQVDATAPCGRLTVEQRQIVEIARALAAGTKCLLLDEPTAALERGAIRRLFERVRQLTAAGVAVLYISHHLEEVFDICQDVAVVRDGELVLTAPCAGLSRDDLVTAMVGAAGGTTPQSATSTQTSRPATAATSDAPPRLSVQDVYSDSPRGALRGVSLTVRAGERVGVTGLLSAGVATLARAVAGAEPIMAGTISLDGRELTPGRRDLAVLAGVGYVPEDRQAEGFVGLLGVAENSAMTIMDRLARLLGLLRPQTVNAAAAPLVRRLSIVAARPGQPVRELSGGNQQKVTAARALAREPKLIVAITPTRGVDVASKSLLLTELAEAAATPAAERPDQAGLLLATDELDDLVICDRVVVLVRGEVFTEFTGPPCDREALIAATEGLARTGGPDHGQAEADAPPEET
jgi:simple sugar transport system ATP-binding protein